MIKISIDNQSLKIDNVESGITLILIAKKDVSIEAPRLYENISYASMFNINLGYSGDILNEPLSNCIDENDEVFTIDSFLAFATASLGFNGGGTSPTVNSVTGDCVDNNNPLNPIINAVPLSGTGAGNPVTGDIEIEGSYTEIHSPNYYLGIGFNPSGDSGNGQLYFYNNNGKNTFSIFKDRVDLNMSPIISPLARGITATMDFSANLTNLDYPQTIYVNNKGGASNATTVVLSASDLNAAYPEALIGFRVFAASIITGAIIYHKTATGWLSTLSTIVA